MSTLNKQRRLRLSNLRRELRHVRRVLGAPQSVGVIVLSESVVRLRGWIMEGEALLVSRKARNGTRGNDALRGELRAAVAEGKREADYAEQVLRLLAEPVQFKIGGIVTGRFSSSAPNIQNTPRSR